MSVFDPNVTRCLAGPCSDKIRCHFAIRLVMTRLCSSLLNTKFRVYKGRRKLSERSIHRKCQGARALVPAPRTLRSERPSVHKNRGGIFQPRVYFTSSDFVGK